MTAETLEKPIDSSVELAHAALNNTITNLNLMERELDHSMALVRRVDVGTNQKEYGNTRLEIDAALKGGTEAKYKTVVKAAKIREEYPVEDGYLEGEVIRITPERIAKDLSEVSRGFRISRNQGLLTQYSAEKSPTHDQFDDSLIAPWDALRRPVPVTAHDQGTLLKTSDDEKTAVLCELLDPYRFRQDADADPKTGAINAEEQGVAMVLLESMGNSWQRDLLATESIKYFLNSRVNRYDLAKRALQLISVPELSSALSESMKLTLESTPSSIVQKAKETGPKALDSLLSKLSAEDRERLKKEAAEKADDFAVTINLDRAVLEKILFDTYHFLPVTEIRKSGGNKFESGSGRVGSENIYGTHPSQEAYLDRPIYGALAVTDHERLFGARNAEVYGSTVVTIKPEVAKDRAVYTYGDSMNKLWLEPGINEDNGPSMLMDLDSARVAKLRYDNQFPGKEAGGLGYWYVEAEVLGGVSVEDIDTITVSFSDAVFHSGLLTKVRTMYPSIGLKLRATQEQYDKVDPQNWKKLEDSGVDIVVLPNKRDQITATAA